jgi:hypothetical protein
VYPRLQLVSFAAAAVVAAAAGCGRIGYQPVALETDAAMDRGAADARPPPADAQTPPADAQTPPADAQPFDELPAPTDAPVAEAPVAADGAEPDLPPAPDAGPDVAAACSGPFSTPEVVFGLGLALELYGPRPRADALGLYLSATRGTPYLDEDIFVAARPARSSDFGRPRRVDELNSAAQDGAPFPAVDELSMFFTSSRPGGRGRRDLWAASRPAPGAPFEAPINLTALNSEEDDQGPSLTADGRTMFFASDRRGGAGDEDLWVATRPNTSATFAGATNLAELNTPGVDSSPFITGDGRTLYFVSDRPGTRGLQDIWRATRETPTGPFEPPINVAEVNTPAMEDDPALTGDGRELFFASGRGGAIQIWHALRCR